MEIKLFPVPVSQNLTIEVSNPDRKGLTLHIFNISGQSVFTKEINGQENVKCKINVSSFKAGVYVLRTITEKGKVMVKKFVVQH